MARNDFLVWDNTSANLASQTDYAAAAPAGVAAGLASSALANKTWRQGTAMAAMLAQFIVNETGQDVVDDGTTATILANFIAALGHAGRIRLTAPTTFYVSPSGSDSTGDGSSGAPWATLQHAVNVLQANYDFGGFQVTCSMADGSYNTPTLIPSQFVGQQGGGSSFIILGNPGSPNLVQSIIGSSTDASNISVAGGAVVTINGLSFVNSSTGTQLAEIAALDLATVFVQNCSFGVCTGSSNVQLACNSGAFMTIVGNYTITGGANAHMETVQGGVFYEPTVTVTLTGTPAFGAAFVIATECGTVAIGPGASFSGSATGLRYDVNLNGVINTNGGGATFFPGSVSGASASGGQYG